MWRWLLNPASIALAGVALILWLERGRLDQALWWTAVLGVAVVYPTARFALRRPGAQAGRRARAPVYAMGAICCAGGLVILWALGAPRAAAVLLLCGLLGALIGLLLDHYGRALPVALALTVFVGGAVLIYLWLGLGVLALGAWMSWARVASRKPPGFREAALPGIIAAWVLGLGLAWGVYLPVLGVWKFVGFWWGFVRWLGA